MARGIKKVELEIVVGYPELGRVEGRYDVDASQLTDTFAVNREVKIDPDGGVEYASTWNVTHVPTGYALLPAFPTASTARAAVELLEAGTYGEIGTDNPDLANQECLQKGIVDLGARLSAIMSRTKDTKKLARRIKREAARLRGRGVERAAARVEGTPEATPRKKAAKKKPAAQREHDLLAMVRKARGNPTDEVLTTKERLLNW